MENKKLRVVVTGAGGFVGERLMEIDRDRFELVPVSLRTTPVEAIDLSGVDSIVHLAGKAHEMKPVDDQVYYDVNYGLTKKLAEEARRQKVPHFVYISSVKVWGDETGGPLNEHSPCEPTDAYGKSKLQAEEMLLHGSAVSFKVAVVRPPLVYGPRVKGNMIKLLQLADKNYPLPFGGIRNLRSMVYVDNLVELINTIVDQQASGIYLAGDEQPVSTEFLVRTIRKSLGKPENMISLPGAVRMLLRAVKPALYTRLYGSYIIDNSLTNKRLSFHPPVSTQTGIRHMVDWYKEMASRK
ncbi:MAG: NAD-dependent epimerase/dehydratase family protein [Williamsia sp.]|nr:NAD-dependent epimerase/dehydratase family protein [Williamsia sp.]